MPLTEKAANVHKRLSTLQTWREAQMAEMSQSLNYPAQLYDRIAWVFHGMHAADARAPKTVFSLA